MDMLERLLRSTRECYDELIVIHDGAYEESAGAPGSGASIPTVDFEQVLKRRVPQEYVRQTNVTLGSISQLVQDFGGVYFEGPRCHQQEPHWPFAWWYATYDWILRLDADEFPSEELRQWLIDFRSWSDEQASPAGFMCIWPLWTGRKAVSQSWPDDRIFLIHKGRVRFPAMVEQTPVPDTFFTKVPLVLHHQPKRKSYGIRNFLLRPQAYVWRRVIANSLLDDATTLPRWRWTDKQWPSSWEELRLHPLKTAVRRLLFFPIHTARTLLHHQIYRCLYSVPFAGVHHFLIGCLLFLYARQNSGGRE
jgi:hypothetical protein